MRNLNYKNRSIRISDENWEILKKKKLNFNSWNLLFSNLLKNEKIKNNRRR
jgi:hypothetical protein